LIDHILENNAGQSFRRDGFDKFVCARALTGEHRSRTLFFQVVDLIRQSARLPTTR